MRDRRWKRLAGVGKSAHALALSAVVSAGLLLTACGGEEPATEASNTRETSEMLAVAGTDRLRFDPDELTIPADEQITLELRAAAVEHDFVIADAAEKGDTDTGHQADDPDDLHIAHANAGESVTGTFTIDDPGTYTVYCSVAGHRDAGMIASLEVTDAGQRSTP